MISLILQTNIIENYLSEDKIIDYSHPLIQNCIRKNFNRNSDSISLIKFVYEWVRDEIPHSFDINGKTVTLKASDVLKYKEGICFAKAHLLAAFLRALAIPTGFCYQKLILDDEQYPYLILHGLNAVFIKELNKWVRLDSRGNKEGVNAQFNLEKEELAFPVRFEKGELDLPTIYISPLDSVIKSLTKNKTVLSLKENLPKEI